MGENDLENFTKTKYTFCGYHTGVLIHLNIWSPVGWNCLGSMALLREVGHFGEGL